MCRFSSPVDFIVSYNATLTSTLHGSDKLKVQKKPEVQKDDLTKILLIRNDQVVQSSITNTTPICLKISVSLARLSPARLFVVKWWWQYPVWHSESSILTLMIKTLICRFLPHCLIIYTYICVDFHLKYNHKCQDWTFTTP